MWSAECGMRNVCNNINTINAKAGAVFPYEFQALGRNVVGDEPPFTLHELSDVGEFAAGGGAKIQHRFPRARIEFPYRQQGAGILHIEQALPKTRERAKWGM